jgi:hypothetical protein
LRDAVAEEPPLDFDADELVTRARHQVMRRRALLAGVATVAVVAAVTVPVALGRGAAPVADRPATSIESTTKPAPSTSRPAEPYSYTAEELRRRSQQMASHLLRAVPAALPEASAFDVGEFGGEAAGDFHDGQTYANAPVSFTIAGARYSIFVTAWVPGTQDQSSTTVCDTGCQQLGETDGGEVVAKTETEGYGIITTVYHFRSNGGIVQIAGYNYDMAGHTQQVYMPTLPMTLDQLARLATDPELGL